MLLDLYNLVVYIYLKDFLLNINSYYKYIL
ncbi:hypothetical protein XFF6991_580005 [Xanthomonas phaseoli pv. phaseoli]|uniref:Uncharacterized protein n=1 Tax=Xanthomonas campestris pv. phaseoli TaxID=317013 RepID=A0A7Z7NJ59_XANCH|nr:hypothetical protein XFF6991_580005 [Xanthomonas phaseoli pv. phaseoli]